MDHVINSLQEWLSIYENESDGFEDENAVECIKKALGELEKYYTHYDNEDFRN